jgi:hypothetical protein
MALGFPILTTGQSTGTTYLLNGNTYTWDGSVWNLTSKSLTLSNLNSQGLTIAGTTATINGSQIVTSATINQYVQTNLSLIAGVDISLSTTTGGYTVVSNTSTFNTVTARGAVTNNAIQVANTSNTTAPETGAISVLGGVGIVKDLYVGGNIYTNGRYVLTTSSLFRTVASGPDILITATIATTDTPGYLVISDISTLQSVTSRGNYTNQKINVTNQTQSTSTNSGALTVSGGVGIGGNLTVNTVQIGFTNLSSNQITINTTATTRIDSYSFTSFRSTKYLVQIQSGATGQSLEVIEILLMVDNSGNVYATEYGIITNNGELGEFSADETNNTVSLYFQPYIAPAYIKFFKTTMAF